MVEPPEKAVWRFFKKLSLEVPHDAATSLPGTDAKTRSSAVNRYLQVDIHCTGLGSFIYKTPKTQVTK